ncbi:MAG: carboxypeptidase regulatory-like domain-containing protein, partial [Myxococcales bacterium]|nr:carboxypeptidase regulatory-like domain-containing protein [Myxococcales bacterium]
TGAVRLADNASPAGARVLVRISGTQLTFAQLVADADGAFSVAAAADEAYDVLATLEGYAPLALGPLVYDAEQDRFEDEQGERPILVLTPAP